MKTHGKRLILNLRLKLKNIFPMDSLLRNRNLSVLSGVLCLLCAVGLVVAQDEYKTQETSSISNSSESLGELFRKRMIGKAATILSAKFHDASNEELGSTTLENILDSLHPSTRSLSDDDLVLTISERLSAKINTATLILQDMKKNLMNDSNLQSFTYPCPLNSFKKSHHLRDIKINSDKVTLNIPKSNFKSYIKNAAKKFNFKVKRQYFLSVKDAATDQVCGPASTRSNSRKLFHHLLQPQPEHFLFLLDSSRLDIEGARLASSLLHQLLTLLLPRDSVGLLSVGNSAMVPLTGHCDNQTAPVGYATDKNKDSLFKYLNSIDTSDTSPNITKSFETVLDTITSSNVSNVSIIYIGDVSYLASEMEKIAKLLIGFKNKFNSQFIISGCDIHISGDNEKSQQITNKIISEVCHNYGILCAESIIHFNGSTSVGQVASRLLLHLPIGPTGDRVQVGLPLWEPLQRDLLVPVVLPVAPLGLLALDLYLSDLAEDIIYFNSFTQRRRAFLVDFSGNVIAHSTYPRPEVIVSEPKLIDISFLEPTEEFYLVKRNMLRDSSGTLNIKTKEAGVDYTWKSVKGLYIVCVVSESVDGTKGRGEGGRLAGGVARELQHHRMDLLPPAHASLCRHFQQVATIHKGTLYLSPSSFQSPFQYLYDIRNGKDVSLTLMRSYMAYLKDTTRLLSNPGLKSDVRNDVGILNPILSYFKRQHIRGAFNKYIVRRYAASKNGVLVMFPGSILESDFEPNRKPWFARALRNPRKVVLTPPHLDSGGAGYIITVSRAPTGSIENSKPSIVLSMDMSMGYLYKLLLDSLPLCVEHNIKCFIMDNRGYLLSHPGLMDPAGSGPVERQHVTHKESLIANDMLNQRGFVQKQLCKNYADGTVQRFYEFNTSLDNVLTNIVHGEHCARYYISAIPGTNTFVGMVNSSCNLGAFCPCSVVDRLCLNCNRMEQSECECPCECALIEDTCFSPPSAVPLCDFLPEKNTRKNHFFYSMASHLDSCFDFQCESYSSKSACLGVLGCEWCQLDRDGESGLAAPYCGVQATCFGGVLGGPTPYGEGSLGQVARDDQAPAYSAVGPIAGCAVALCLILALAVYCYKQNLAAEASEPYPVPLPEAWSHGGLRAGGLNSEDDIRDERSGHLDKPLLVVEPVAPVSPYRILTGYRRPNTAGESDHGYSTMTPHDDSEHQAFALVEPFLAPGGPSPSLSPARGNTEVHTTQLPCGKHHVLAPVTVHRHMEAT